MVRAPETILTARLRLRRPQPQDAATMFTRYAGDGEATRLMSWPTHTSVEQTRAFLAFSDAEWERWPAGPYLIESQDPPGTLLGSTGFAFEDAHTASTGYILARDSWGRGYATEALAALVDLAPRLGIRLFYALAHPENLASQRVLEKCGFTRDDRQAATSPFPNNLSGGGAAGPPQTCLYFARRL